MSPSGEPASCRDDEEAKSAVSEAASSNPNIISAAASHPFGFPCCCEPCLCLLDNPKLPQGCAGGPAESSQSSSFDTFQADPASSVQTATMLWGATGHQTARQAEL